MSTGLPQWWQNTVMDIVMTQAWFRTVSIQPWQRASASVIFSSREQARCLLPFGCSPCLLAWTAYHTRSSLIKAMPSGDCPSLLYPINASKHDSFCCVGYAQSAILPYSSQLFQVVCCSAIPRQQNTCYCCVYVPSAVLQPCTPFQSNPIRLVLTHDTPIA